MLFPFHWNWSAHLPRSHELPGMVFQGRLTSRCFFTSNSGHVANQPRVSERNPSLDMVRGLEPWEKSET